MNLPDGDSNQPRDKGKPEGSRPSLLSERARRAELAFFEILLLLLSLSLVWTGVQFLRDLRAGFLFVPLELKGPAAALLGIVHVAAGTAILFATWAMVRWFR
jgi:hypothetical protein